MPGGPTKIPWNQENDDKLLLSIISIHKLKVDCKAVAETFGKDIPYYTIKNRLDALRKKYPTTSSSGSTQERSTVAKPAAPRVKANPKPKTPKRKAKTMLSNNSDGDDPMTPELSDDDSDTDHRNKRYRTAPQTPNRQMSIVGQVTKPRVSPRNLAKKDYRALENPLANDDDLYDSDGNKIFDDELGMENEGDASGSNSTEYPNTIQV